MTYVIECSADAERQLARIMHEQNRAATVREGGIWIRHSLTVVARITHCHENARTARNSG